MQYVVGEEAEDPCNVCRNGSGPFQGCILPPPGTDAARYACANCRWNWKYKGCKHNPNFGANSSLDRGLAAAAAPVVEGPARRTRAQVQAAQRMPVDDPGNVGAEDGMPIDDPDNVSAEDGMPVDDLDNVGAEDKMPVDDPDNVGAEDGMLVDDPDNVGAEDGEEDESLFVPPDDGYPQAAREQDEEPARNSKYSNIAYPISAFLFNVDIR
ncbi:hypothetical protein F5X96DRAFT_618925 [Biscogniauxia mediterranea]|nr:hypothetical protein F5X96DRAFT_618925 [Biscogniauxia mediterranea]